MPILGILASAIKKAIQDLFNRTTTGSLGTANTGQIWGATRGVWFANGSAAQSNDTASNYPLALILLNTNVTVSAVVTEGTGVSFWVTDANNWYATVAYRTQTSYSCNCQTCCTTCTHTGGSCGTTTGQNCTECGTTYTCSVGCVAGSICQNCSTGAYIGPATATCNTCTYGNTCTNADCTACGSYSCNCQTCYNNYYYMRMLKSISGTVSTVISDYAVASLPVAIKVVTNNGTITETAYSDSGMTTSLGSTSTTPSSPIQGLGVGIIKAPAAVSQGSTVDTFNAN